MTTEAEPRTSAEIGGMGHSVKRKEDPRFIRGVASTSTTSTCPASSGWTSSAAPMPTRRSRAIDATEALKIPGVLAVITGKDLEKATASTGCRRSPATSRWCFRSTPSCTSHRKSRRSSPRPSTSRRTASRPCCRLRAAAGHRRSVQGARAGRVRPSPRPRARQGQQPHVALGIRRRAEADAALAAADVTGSPRTSTSRASTSPRSRPAAASRTGTPSAVSSPCT